MAHQQLAALGVEDDAAVHAAADFHAHAAGHVRLDQARDHVGLRTLGGQDQVDAHGAGFLCDADDAGLDLFVGHHQVGEFVDDEDQVRHLLGDAGGVGVVFDFQAVFDFVPAQVVVGADVAHAHFSQQLVALVHLGDGPLENLSGFVHLGHHRAHQVGDGFEHTHLDHLGVDQHQLELVGPLGVQETHDDRVHAHALTRAGGAGDEHVGHGVEVLHQGVAAGVFAQEHGQLHLGDCFAVDAHELFKPYALFLGVGHLDADGVFARHVGHHADVGCPQGAGQVAVHRGNAADLGAGRQAHFKERDDRARVDVDDLAFDAVFEQSGLQFFALLAHDLVHLFAEAVFGFFQQVDAGELIAREVHLADGGFVNVLLFREVDGHLGHLGPQGAGVEVLLAFDIGVGRVGDDFLVVLVVAAEGFGGGAALGLAIGPGELAGGGGFFLLVVVLVVRVEGCGGAGLAAAAWDLHTSAFEIVFTLHRHAGEVQAQAREAGHFEAWQGGDGGELFVHRVAEFDHAFGRQPRQGQHDLVHRQQCADPERQGQQQQGPGRGEASHQFFLNQQAQQAAGAFGPGAHPGDEAVGRDSDQPRGGGGHDGQARGPQGQLIGRAVAQCQHDARAQAQHGDPDARAHDQVGLVGDGGAQRAHPVLGRGVGDPDHVAGGVGGVVAQQRRGDDEPGDAGDGQAHLLEGGKALGLLFLGELFLLAGGHRVRLRRAVRGEIESRTGRGARSSRARPVTIGPETPVPTKNRGPVGSG